MPARKFFAVTLHGFWQEAMLVPLGRNDKPMPIKGFYASRKIAAYDQERAIEFAMQSMSHELEEMFGGMDGYIHPEMEIDNISQMNWLKFRFSRTPNRGASYY